jgi:hypothetical protein
MLRARREPRGRDGVLVALARLRSFSVLRRAVMTRSFEVSASIVASTLLAASFAGCAHENQFPFIAVQAAAQQPTSCISSRALEAVALEREDAFRVDTCDGPTYWRCFDKRPPKKVGLGLVPKRVDQLPGRGQCCVRVSDEEEATLSSLPYLEDDSIIVCRDGP